MNICFKGTGHFLPEKVQSNEDFLAHEFYTEEGERYAHSNQDIIDKFQAITGIQNRRYIDPKMLTSDMGFEAAKKAIEDAAIDKEAIDYIIFAHNFGDVVKHTIQTDVLPALATRVKHGLNIKNPMCVAYDILFGCPGWIEGVIQANAFIKSGIAKKCLVIGAETLSRVVDAYDRDSMIYADGAGATIIEASDKNGEILAHASATYAYDEANYLFFGPSYSEKDKSGNNYIKMHGRKIYEFPVTNVPAAMKECLDSSGLAITDVKKIFIHQANEKMDEAIVKRFYKAYGMQMPEGIMPMNIKENGNSSVATIPTLFDMVKNGKLENHSITKGDVVIFASVGAGMNINAIIYRH